jgi:hypothetical protein
MNYQDIQSAMAALYHANENFDAIMEENGGELTPEAEDLENVKNALQDLLSGEGIDSLGRWLKAKEDEKATYKAEKAAADRRIKSVDKTIDFINHEIGRVLRATGQEKVKGTFYSFSQFDSTKTSFDAKALDEKFLDMVTEAARNAGLPASVDVALKTTATRLQEDENLAELVSVETSETCKFTKPKKEKED